MKCWRCEKELSDGTQECLYCRADQRRAEPVTEPGKALRQLYDRYGAKAVLGNPMLLPNGIGDVISDSLMLDIKKMKSQLRMAMDAGMGRFYLEQLETAGKPDPAFESRVKMLLTEDAEISEKAAENLAGWFDEMIGWKPAPKPSVQPAPQPAAKPSPEIDRQQIYERAVHLMLTGGTAGCKDALDLLKQIRGYKDTDELIRQCRARIAEPAPPSGSGTSTGSREKPSQKIIWAAAAVIAILALILLNNIRGKNKLHAEQTQEALVYTTMTALAQQTLSAGQTETAEIEKTPDTSMNMIQTPIPTSMDADSLTAMGEEAFYSGNYSAAVDYFRQAAEQGHYFGQAWLGNCYYNGIGIDQDYAEAVKWFRLSADQNYSWAQYMLGECYYYGNGVERSNDSALYYYQKAYDQGYTDAQTGIKRITEQYPTNTPLPTSTPDVFAEYRIDENGFIRSYYGNDTNVVIPSGAKGIYSGAFRGKKEIRSVVIPNGVITIDDDAFSGCTALASVTIPDTVTSIGDSAFSKCSSLSSIIIPNSIRKIGKSAFYNCDSLKSIEIPRGVTEIGNNTFMGCSDLQFVTIPNSVKSIGDFAFCSCSNLRSVTIPDSVTSIGVQAFYECNNLTSLKIPGSLVSMGDDAFSRCENLKSVTIQNGVKSIWRGAFSSCKKLSYVSIPNSVTSIEYAAFLGCSNLNSITIPASVSFIDTQAFEINCVLNVKKNSYADRWCEDNYQKCTYY